MALQAATLAAQPLNASPSELNAPSQPAAARPSSDDMPHLLDGNGHRQRATHPLLRLRTDSHADWGMSPQSAASTFDVPLRQHMPAQDAMLTASVVTESPTALTASAPPAPFVPHLDMQQTLCSSSALPPVASLQHAAAAQPAFDGPYGSLVVLGFRASLQQISSFSDAGKTIGDEGNFRMELWPHDAPNGLTPAAAETPPLVLTAAQLKAQLNSSSRMLLSVLDFLSESSKRLSLRIRRSSPSIKHSDLDGTASSNQIDSAGQSPPTSPEMRQNRRIVRRWSANPRGFGMHTSSAESLREKLPVGPASPPSSSAPSRDVSLPPAAFKTSESPKIARRGSTSSFMSTGSVIASAAAHIAIQMPTSPRRYAWYGMRPAHDLDMYTIGRIKAPGIDFVVPGRACVKRGSSDILVSRQPVYDFRIVCNRTDPSDVRVHAGRFEKRSIVCGSKNVRWASPLTNQNNSQSSIGHAQTKSKTASESGVDEDCMHKRLLPSISMSGLSATNMPMLPTPTDHLFDAFPIGSGLLVWRPIRDEKTGKTVSGKWMEISVMGHAFEVRKSADERGRPIDPRIFPDLVRDYSCQDSKAFEEKPTDLDASSHSCQNFKNDMSSSKTEFLAVPSLVPLSLSSMYTQLNRLVDGCIIHTGGVSFLWQDQRAPWRQRPTQFDHGDESNKFRLFNPCLTRQEIVFDVERISQGLTCPITLDTIPTECLTNSIKDQSVFKNMWVFARLKWLVDLRDRIRSTKSSQHLLQLTTQMVHSNGLEHDGNQITPPASQFTSTEALTEPLDVGISPSTSSLSVSSSMLSCLCDPDTMHTHRPWFFSNCGHVFSLYDPQMRQPDHISACSVCRTPGSFIPITARVAPDIITGRLEYAFDPCGHMIDAESARVWTTIVSMPPVPMDPRISDVSPVLVIPHTSTSLLQHQSQLACNMSRSRSFGGWNSSTWHDQHDQMDTVSSDVHADELSHHGGPMHVPYTTNGVSSSLSVFLDDDVMGSDPLLVSPTQSEMTELNMTTLSRPHRNLGHHYISSLFMYKAPVSINIWGPCCPFCGVKILGARKLFFQHVFD